MVSGATLLRSEAADLLTYVSAAFGWLQGSDELKEKLYMKYKAAVDNRDYNRADVV